MTLTEFLLARIDEDEAVARRTAERMEHAPPTGIGGVGNLGIVGYPFVRVLAECEAKRSIVERASGWIRPTEGMDGEDILMDYALALPYADHPDYDPEWKP